MPQLFLSSSRILVCSHIIASFCQTSITSTLHPLLKKNTSWVWGTGQAKAFSASKELLTSSNCLTHFDSSLVLTLACDASNYGVGAVLFHKMTDGSERPIAYASRTLNSSEHNYLQLEKEGLSCDFTIISSAGISNS